MGDSPDDDTDTAVIEAKFSTTIGNAVQVVSGNLMEGVSNTEFVPLLTMLVPVTALAKQGPPAQDPQPLAQSLPPPPTVAQTTTNAEPSTIASTEGGTIFQDSTFQSLPSVHIITATTSSIPPTTFQSLPSITTTTTPSTPSTTPTSFNASLSLGLGLGLGLGIPLLLSFLGIFFLLGWYSSPHHSSSGSVTVHSASTGLRAWISDLRHRRYNELDSAQSPRPPSYSVLTQRADTIRVTSKAELPARTRSEISTAELPTVEGGLAELADKSWR